MPLELITIDLEKLKIHISSKLMGFPEIQGAYLFGSCLEKMRPDSDIDLGIIFVESPKQKVDLLIEKVYSLLGRFDGHPFDIVSVRDVNIILAFKIFRHGIPVYISDNDKVTDLIEQISRKHSDIYPRYRRALEIVSGMRSE
jgi:predicted nucleotidyltransferase